jgi:altronate dehydratase
MTDFIGFPRPDATVGVRSHILLLGLDFGGGNVCYRVAELVRGVIPVLLNVPDFTRLSHMVRHPNVAGVMLVKEEIDEDTIKTFVSEIERTGKPHGIIELSGLGTMDAISKTTLATVELIRDVSTQRRQLIQFSTLLLGLINVPVGFLTGVLDGFIKRIFEENARCLWVPKEGEADRKMSGEMRRHLVGNLKHGQTIGKDPGIYMYSVPERIHKIWKTIFEFGAQLAIVPLEDEKSVAHPLIPVVQFTASQDTDAGDIYDLDLSKVIHGKLSTEEAGLLFFNEILSTASGKLTKDEILKDVVITY